MLNKKLIEERLLEIIAMLHSIPEHGWNYEHIISEFDYNHNCGTVCCALGWYPKYMPKTNIIWRDGIVTCLNDTESVDQRVCNYHGICKDLMDVIFYGVPMDRWNIPNLEGSTMADTTKEQVISRVETIIKHLHAECEYSTTFFFNPTYNVPTHENP